MTDTPNPRPARPSSKAAIHVALLIALMLSSSGILAHPLAHPDGRIPLPAEGATRLAANPLPPGEFVCELDGPLLDAVADPDPQTSGLSGTLVVSGMPIRLPASVPIQLGETPGDFLAFDDLLAEPAGFGSLLGTEVSVTGTMEVVPDTGEGFHLLCTADFVLVNVGHPPILGVVTESGPGVLAINGVPIEAHPDPRVAPFVRIMDLAGAALDFEDFPVGALATANGDYNATTGSIQALLIVLEEVAPPQPDADDHLAITRAEARIARPELRVRGVVNNEASVITLWDYSTGTQGAQLATGIRAPPGAAGEWEFRGDIPLTAPTPSGRPSAILATTDHGGFATAPVNLR